MACILRFSAPDCDIDGIVAEVALSVENLFRQGEQHTVLPKLGAFTASGFQLVASEAGFEHFKQQVTDTITFIKANRAALQQLAVLAAQLEGSLLVFDFGIATRMFEVVAQSDYFPPELVRLAGELNAGLELSQYPPAAEDS